MDTDLAQEAISCALTGKWREALKINKKILQSDTRDVDALNRLARAYAELGELDSAKKSAQKVIKLDPFNAIAQKSLEKWKGLKKGDTYRSNSVTPRTFLEEPGKTKIITLMHLGSPKLISKLDSADEVILNTRSHRVTVCTEDSKYIGKLPDDLSARLRRLIKLGNEYQAFIKSANKNEVKIFIREIKRSAKLTDIPSFSPDKIEYISFTPPELVHKKDESRVPTEEED